MSFCDASDGGVARHLRDQIDVERVQRGLQAHARCRHRGLAASMSGSDHNYIEMFVKVLHPLWLFKPDPGGKKLLVQL